MTIHSVEPINSQTLGVSDQQISEAAMVVIRALKEAGFSAYIVGGGIRDILLNTIPKDFDVVTNAHPEQIQTVFGRRCRLIGRRFRLAHVRHRREIIEVATYRTFQDDIITSDKKVVSDNAYGSNMEEDALRRDFRINALYYDPVEHLVYDHTNGLADIQNKRLTLIGDPDTRYKEDPARMLRAIRLATKLDLTIEPTSVQFILENGHLLQKVASARMFDEILKLFLSGCAHSTLHALVKSELFACLFPDAWKCWKTRPEAQTLLSQVMINTDTRLNIGKPVTPAFLFAALLWYPLLDELSLYKNQALFKTEIDAFHAARSEIILRQLQICSIPKRFSYPMVEMWEMQQRLEQRKPSQISRLMAHRRFRAAYDLLLLREEAGELSTNELGQWWTLIQEVAKTEQEAMIAKLPKPVKKKKRSTKKKPQTKT